MKYKDGSLILTKEERKTLSEVTMNEIDECIDFASYIDELMMFKEGITQMKKNHQDRRERTERDDAIISLIDVMVEVLEQYIILGYQAAKMAGGSTSVH